MNNPSDYPCRMCKYFAGIDEVETLGTLGTKYNVEIPICGFSALTLAIGLCGRFVPSDCFVKAEGIVLEDK